ncbi:MAG: glycosyltransferase [Patescibacteria group bacterium]
MKIAYFTSNRTTFPPDPSQIAASTTVTTNIIKELSKRHKITLYAAKGSHMDGIDIEDLNLEPFRIDSSLADNDWITKAVVSMKQVYIGEIFKRAREYDIIHLQTEPIYMAMPYISLIKTPILFTAHNMYHDFEKAIFSFYDKKIYISALSNAQAKRYPLTQEIPVIYNGIEVEEFPYDEKGGNYFLFLGRLAKDKGIDVFLDLAINNPKFQFYIVGKGYKEYEQKAQEAARKYSHIKYFGMIPRATPQWFDLLSKAKALVMPVNYEDSCPLVPLEAMACGSPVIAYAAGALPEQVVDNKTGYLICNSKQANYKYIIEQTGINGLIHAINKINSLSKQDYLRFRRNARTRIEDFFSIKKMAKNYEKLYLRIIKERPLA